MGKIIAKQIDSYHMCPSCGYQINIFKDAIKTIRKIRNIDDFKWGSFRVFVDEKENFIITGVLKKTNNNSPYIMVYSRER